MAGRISDRDIAIVRERSNIEEVVGEYVALRRAGADSMVGLCPFHDEKTPSFHVRPNHGHFHCFGCGEGGDVIAFLQKIDHIEFVEAIERLAGRLNYSLTYEGGGPSVQRDRGTRTRLIAANRAAQEFYAEQLRTPVAAKAREYLLERDFDEAAALDFGCGYAPEGWDTLTKHLLRQGFEPKELEDAGLSRPGQRGGHVDRFRRRLVWPIRNLGGDVIGFGARRLFDDDQMTAKYLNTSETVLYKKSTVLFGIDRAKKEIARGHQVVVVEGYTDVMAMHASGVKTAVASCGTAFGEEHIALIRRLMMDDNYFRGEVIYTFDGDAAGKAAALKAFDGDQKIAGQTFVAIAPDGMDPCELRQAHGDVAVRELVAKRVPMFEFAIKATLAEYDLDTAEGRVQALRRTVPIVARIKDGSLRDEYARQLSGWVGWEETAQVVRRVRQEASRPTKAALVSVPVPEGGPNPRDPRLWAQREALKVVLQYPQYAGTVFDALPTECFTHTSYQLIHAGIVAAGGTAAGLGGAEWVQLVKERLPDRSGERLLSELAAEDLPANEKAIPRYSQGVLARIQEVWVGGQIADIKSKLKRMSPANDPGYNSLFGDLVALEAYRRSLLEQAFGEDARPS